MDINEKDCSKDCAVVKLCKESVADLLNQIKLLQAENGRLKEEIERIHPKHRHDHDYFHSDCGLCQLEQQEYQERKRKERLNKV